MKLKSKGFVLFVALFGFLSRAEACPVCFQSGAEERWAFYFTTAFLTVLPLLMVGCFIFFLRKRFVQLEADHST